MDSLDLKIVREMGFRPYGNRPQDPEAFKPSYLGRGGAIKKVEPIDGLVEIHNFMGPEMCVDLSHRGPEDLSRKLRLLAEFTGDAAPPRFYERQMPSVA